MWLQPCFAFHQKCICGDEKSLFYISQKSTMIKIIFFSGRSARRILRSKNSISRRTRYSKITFWRRTRHDSGFEWNGRQGERVAGYYRKEEILWSRMSWPRVMGGGALTSSDGKGVAWFIRSLIHIYLFTDSPSFEPKTIVNLNFENYCLMLKTIVNVE
jgi:hypothetical protein